MGGEAREGSGAGAGSFILRVFISLLQVGFRDVSGEGFSRIVIRYSFGHWAI